MHSTESFKLKAAFVTQKQDYIHEVILQSSLIK